jgi:hypothetical protein
MEKGKTYAWNLIQLLNNSSKHLLLFGGESESHLDVVCGRALRCVKLDQHVEILGDLTEMR